ncbi:MAG: type IV secretion system protein VirB10 [Solirubrobacteraceae bacterium]
MGSAAEPSVAGERGISSINRARPLQSRVTNLLAMGLMSSLGLGLLGWYYAHTFAMQSQARRSAQNAANQQAAGNMPLPSIGPITPPNARAPARPSVLASALGPPPAPPPTAVTDGVAATASPLAASTYGVPVTTGLPAKSRWEIALERRLSGPAFDTNPSGPSATTPEESASPAVPPAAEAAPAELPPGEIPSGGAPSSALATLLTPTITPVVRPSVLPTLRLLLPKGAFIDCTLETAIDSTLPGMTTCVTAADTFSADGTVVLLPRGTKLVGETRGQVQQGTSRVFVLWTEARTPSGVVIPLDSPGTDALGRSGLAGKVNRHFWQRFGAAILISVINGAVQYGVQSQNQGGAVIYDPGATQEVMTEALKGTVNIPPTVTVANGSRIQVLVARDVDFRSVYALRPFAQR